MNKKLVSVIGAIALFCGCSTTNPNQTATEQLLVTTAAAAGTEIVLQKNPSYAPALAASAIFLQQLGGGTNQLTVAQVQSAMTLAGETNSSVQLLEPLVVNLLNAYAANQGATNGVPLTATTSQLLNWTGVGVQQGVAAAQHP